MGASTAGGEAAVVPSLSAVVLAYREEPWLEKCVHALLRSNGVDVNVILVDNGCTDGGVARLAGTPGVELVSPGRNLGFSGGCNGARQLPRGNTSDWSMVTSWWSRMRSPTSSRWRRRPTWVSRVRVSGWPTIRKSSTPTATSSISSASAGVGVSVSRLRSGPCSVTSPQRWVRRSSSVAALWDELGGFDDRYIAYHDDVELCVRCRQRALRVVNVPQAVAVHRYEFSREPQKMFLSERNRLVFVLTALEARTLLLLAPAFVAVEVATLARAVAGGWWRQKLDGWVWLLRNHNWVRRRRRQLQTERTVPDRELASLTATRLRAGNYSLPGLSSAP